MSFTRVFLNLMLLQMLPDGAADVQVLDLSDLPPSQPAPLLGATGGRFSRTLVGEAGNCFAVPFEALRHCFKRHR